MSHEEKHAAGIPQLPAEGFRLLTELLGHEWVVLWKPRGGDRFLASSQSDASRAADIVHEVDQRLSWPAGIPLGES